MGKSQLANVPENWVFSTMEFVPRETKRLLAALPIDTERIGMYAILVKPHRGHEKAVRIICSRVFARVKGKEAREILNKHKAATHS